VWFSKLWPTMSSGFGMLSLAWLDLTMTINMLQGSLCLREKAML
jgi:hypothetical protein